MWGLKHVKLKNVDSRPGQDDLWCDAVPLTSCVAEGKSLCLSEPSVSTSGTATTVPALQAAVKLGGWRALQRLLPLSANTEDICKRCQQGLFSSGHLKLMLCLTWT